jgi:tripartite ATP-independent transporter DctM subunit
MPITVMLTVLLGLLVIGVPVGFTFAAAGIIGGILSNFNIASISSSTYYGLASFPILAIPLFILAGELMNSGKLVDKLEDVSELCFFWLPGRTGHVSIVASAFLGAMTGSSVATVAAISSSMGKKMRDKGYADAYVASINAASGLLGVLIPPSIPLIVYGAAVGVSVSELFLATVIPGVIMTVTYMVLHSICLSKVLDKSSAEGKSESVKGAAKEVWKGGLYRILRAIPAMVLPFIILGGIYSGLMTPTESAGIGGFYALIIIVVCGMVGIGQIPDIFWKAAKTAGSILVIIGFTCVFNKIMTLMQIPQIIAEITINLTASPYVFLLFVNIILFLAGMFMETNAAVLLLSPLLFPAAMALGIDPVHFGIVLVTNIEIGLITPPMAANIYVSARINNSNVVKMWPHCWKYLAVSLLIQMLITYVPAVSIWWK